jgi:hypothetical protein
VFLASFYMTGDAT